MSKILAVTNGVCVIGLSLLPLIAPQGATDPNWNPQHVRMVGSIIVSVVFGAAAILIIFFKKDGADKKWAYGTIGTVLGYWLPSPVQ